jgi:hypothetical protein
MDYLKKYYSKKPEIVSHISIHDDIRKKRYEEKKEIIIKQKIGIMRKKEKGLW